MHEFINLQAIKLESFLESLQGKKPPFRKENTWVIKNEIKPVDLFCYLYAKYGRPNGLLTLARADDSDNLIQWDWLLEGDLGIINIQGHNFRTEIFSSYDEKTMASIEVEDFIKQIKTDFKNYGKDISNIKKNLEKWTEFVNPFKRIQSTIDHHFIKLQELQIDVSKDKVNNFLEEDLFDEMNILLEKYHSAVGIVHGLRSMLPVMAESFINCLIFILCKNDIKTDDRLYDSFIRQPIDIRIKSLPINCNYFISSIDYTTNECKKFHTLMNERNDLLHGNINLIKQKFGTVYFHGNMAVYDEYSNHWQKAIGTLLESVRFEDIYKDRETVNNFIDYILSCIDPKLRENLKELLDRSFLGFNNKTQRLGILFPNHFADIRL